MVHSSPFNTFGPVYSLSIDVMVIVNEGLLKCKFPTVAFQNVYAENSNFSDDFKLLLQIAFNCFIFLSCPIFPLVVA